MNLQLCKPKYMECFDKAQYLVNCKSPIKPTETYIVRGRELEGKISTFIRSKFIHNLSSIDHSFEHHFILFSIQNTNLINFLFIFVL